MAWIRNLFAIQKITNVNINLYFLQKRRDVGYEVNRLPWWLDGKTSACNAGDPRSILRLGKSPGEGIGSPLQYSCLKNGQRSLAGYSPWSCKESYTSEWLTFSVQFFKLYNMINPFKVNLVQSQYYTTTTIYPVSKYFYNPRRKTVPIKQLLSIPSHSQPLVTTSLLSV